MESLYVAGETAFSTPKRFPFGAPDSRASFAPCYRYGRPKHRHPPLLAKMAACVDEMSGGRLEFGVGEGWKEVEYEAYGVPFGTVKERVDRLEEALIVIKLLWTESRASYEGRHFRISEAVCAPKPVQQPHPPVWVGGSRPRVMGIAARYADGVNIAGFPSFEAYKAGLDTLRAACRRYNRDYDSVRKSQFTGIIIADGGEALENLLRDVAEPDIRPFRNCGTASGASSALRRRWVDSYSSSSTSGWSSSCSCSLTATRTRQSGSWPSACCPC